MAVGAIAVAVAVAAAGGYLTFVKGGGREGSPTGGSSLPQSSEKASTGDENLVRLLLRFLHPPGRRRELSFYPGKLPDGLPVEVPIPDDAELIGSMVRGENEGFQVILDVPGKPENIVEFYREQLTEAGWVEKTEERRPGRGGGFTSTAFGPNAFFSRYENKGPALSINIHAPEENAPLGVRLGLEQEYRPRPLHRGPEVLPVLEPPEGVRQRRSGGGSHHGDEYSSEDSEAILETGLDLGDLEAHYRDQLREAGWELQGKDVGKAYAVSSYTFTDEGGNPWKGLLVIHAVGENKRRIFLMASTIS